MSQYQAPQKINHKIINESKHNRNNDIECGEYNAALNNAKGFFHPSIVIEKEKLQSFGFSFEGNQAIFPQKWYVKINSDPRSLHIYDENDKLRIAIFVKATYYDNYARISFID